MEKFIDVEQVIKSKNPKLAKRLPRFVLNYIKKILHEKEFNEIQHRLRDSYDFEFCEEVIKHFNIDVQIHGIENIPKEGAVLLVGNHPLGGMDAMAFVKEMANYRRDLKFIVNDLLLFVKNMRGLFTGVNKHGANSKQSLQEVNDLFASDKAVFLFPAGLVSRKTKGEVMDLTWKKTVITRAIKFNKSVIPVYNDGSLRNFFYRLSNLRKNLGIKANLEMFYLADEFARQRGKTINIWVGEPIPADTFDKTKTHKEWAEWLKQKTYSLKP